MLQHLEAALTAVFELEQYAILLQSSHYQAAALLTNSSTRLNIEQVQADVLKKMQQEWSMVLAMESSGGTSEILAKHCAYTHWQVYRETMTFLESEGFSLNDRLRDFLLAYFPKIQGSCNVEDLFADLQDSIQRSGKSDSGSLSNLAAVSIRSCNRKCQTAGVGTTQLVSADFEGTCVRSLKSSVFRPETCAGSTLAVMSNFLSFSKHNTTLSFLLLHPPGLRCCKLK